MSDLTDAIAYLDGELVDVTHEDPIGIALAAARRVAEAPEVWWCETYSEVTVDIDGFRDDKCAECLGPTKETGCGRKRLVDPPKENQ